MCVCVCGGGGCTSISAARASLGCVSYISVSAENRLLRFCSRQNDIG